MMTLTHRKFAMPHRRHGFRPDKTVEEQLTQQFRATPYRELSRITCRFYRGKATLEGDVGSYYMKQMAQTLAKRVPGVHTVLNHILVRPCEPGPRCRQPCDWID